MRPDGQAPYTCVRNCARPSVHTVTEPASQPAAEPAPGYQHRTHVQLGRYHAHCALFTPLTKHAHMRINAPRAVPACHHRICLICMRRAYVPHGRPPVGPTDVDGLRLRHRATGRAPDYRLRCAGAGAGAAYTLGYTLSCARAASWCGTCAATCACVLGHDGLPVSKHLLF